MPATVVLRCDVVDCAERVAVDLGHGETVYNIGAGVSHKGAHLSVEADYTFDGWFISGGSSFGEDPELRVLCPDHGVRCPTCSGSGSVTHEAARAYDVGAVVFEVPGSTVSCPACRGIGFRAVEGAIECAAFEVSTAELRRYAARPGDFAKRLGEIEARWAAYVAQFTPENVRVVDVPADLSVFERAASSPGLAEVLGIVPCDHAREGLIYPGCPLRHDGRIDAAGDPVPPHAGAPLCAGCPRRRALGRVTDVGEDGTARVDLDDTRP